MFVHQIMLPSCVGGKYSIIFLTGESDVVNTFVRVWEKEGYTQDTVSIEPDNNVTHAVLSKYTDL